jgi:hypothetical protein
MSKAKGDVGVEVRGAQLQSWADSVHGGDVAQAVRALSRGLDANQVFVVEVVDGDGVRVVSIVEKK